MRLNVKSDLIVTRLYSVIPTFLDFFWTLNSELGSGSGCLCACVLASLGR